MDEPAVEEIHLPEMCFSDVATAHLCVVMTYKYGVIKKISRHDCTI
jgi:hypothetical protein